MNRIKTYLHGHALQLFAITLVIALSMAGFIDPATAAGIGIVLDTGPTDLKSLNEAMQKAFKAMEENIKKVQDTAEKAREEVRQEGTLHTKTNEKLTELGEVGNKLSTDFKELRERITDVEQKAAQRPEGGPAQAKSIGQIVAESDAYKSAKGARNMAPVEVGSFYKTAIVNATLNNDQPLVQADRRPMVMPALRRLVIRDLVSQSRTSSNLVEFATENVFTNNAGPQYDASPGGTEGVTKPESGITFTLNSTAVVTLAHFIPASRQVLSDAALLQGYIDGRLRYGLALEEEEELLTGDGTSGTLNGINNQATAFNGGSTNQTALDTILKAFLQVSLASFEASGVILHPTDWANIVMLKDTTGRYLFSDPQSASLPRLWGKDVVATASQTSGKFTAGAFNLAAEIFDREDASVRIAEQHANFFVQNMVAILAEERLALAITRSAAIVYGNISHAG